MKRFTYCLANLIFLFLVYPEIYKSKIFVKIELKFKSSVLSILEKK